MGVMYELADHEGWVGTLQGYARPYWDSLLDGEWAQRLASGAWTLPEMQGWILQLYPFIHAFPKFLAEALIKVEDDESRSFLIDNIRVEKAHAEHWIWMGEGFGLRRAEMLTLAEGDRAVLRDVQSLTDWLWYINTKGSLAEAVAATSFAIEGITGDLSRQLLPAFEAYGNVPGVTMSPRTTRWFRNHAKYDDDHPRIALEVVKRYAMTERVQTRVMMAVKRSLQLLDQALLTSAQAYSPAQGDDTRTGIERRSRDRRSRQVPIAFPERRFRDRRGSAVGTVA